MAGICCQDVMQIDATPAQVRAFIADPERIADYYPGVTEYGTFEPGGVVWCASPAGVGALEIVEAESTDTFVKMHVVTSVAPPEPYTLEGLKASPFLTMTEEWQLEAHGGGTRLTKTWRDVVCASPDVPMEDMIREAMPHERAVIEEAWSRAARGPA